MELKKRKKRGAEREKRGLNQKRIKQKKEEEEKSGWTEAKTFGLKKSILGWKIKGNQKKRKKWGLEKSEGRWSRKESAETEKKKRAEAKKGAD